MLYQCPQITTAPALPLAESTASGAGHRSPFTDHRSPFMVADRYPRVGHCSPPFTSESPPDHEFPAPGHPLPPADLASGGTGHRAAASGDAFDVEIVDYH